MKKRIICLLLIVAFVMMSSLQVFATESESVSTELISLAKEADMLAGFLVFGEGRRADLDPEANAWAVGKGYLDEDGLTSADLKLDEMLGAANLPCYPNSASMDSLDKWTKEVEKYFVGDIYAFVTPHKQGRYSTDTTNYWLIEKDGKTYFAPFVYRLLIANWDTAEFISIKENEAVLSVYGKDVFDQSYAIVGPYTIEFDNTENGWRVSGGSYFGQGYDFENVIQPPAQQTGDNAVHALWLSCAALVCLGVLVFRKKRI